VGPQGPQGKPGPPGLKDLPDLLGRTARKGRWGRSVRRVPPVRRRFGILGYSKIGGAIPITVVDTDIAAGPVVTFTLSAPATVLMEYGGLLVPTSRGTVDSVSPWRSLPRSMDRTLRSPGRIQRDDQQDPANPFTTGQDSVMNQRLGRPCCREHTIKLFVTARRCNATRFFPWLK